MNKNNYNSDWNKYVRIEKHAGKLRKCSLALDIVS